MSDSLDQARALIASYALECAGDDQLPQILLQVRDICGANAFHRLLVLAAAVCDSRYQPYGCADVLPLLRKLTVTNDLKADVEALLDAMRRDDTAKLEAAQRTAAEIDDPYHRAAVRLLRKFRNPNLAQVMRELERL